MISRVISVSIVAAMLISGCATVDRHSERIKTTLSTTESKATFDKQWSKQLGDGPGDTYPLLTAVLYQNTLIATDEDNELVVLDAKTGKKQWSTTVDEETVGSPGVGSGVIAVGANDADVIAYDHATGKRLWQTEVSGEVPSAPTVTASVVIVKTVNGGIHGLSTDTGAVRWSINRDVPLISVRGTGGTLLVGNIAITGLADGKLIAIDIHSGEIQWETTIAAPRGRSELQRLVDIDITPAFSDGVVFASSYQRKVAAVSPDSGEIYWSRELSTAVDIAVDESKLYVVDTDGSIWCLDQANGSTYWRQDLFKSKLTAAVTLYGNRIAVSDLTGHLTLLDTDDGKVIAHHSVTSDELVFSPLIQKDQIIVTDEDGDATSFRVQ